MSNKEILNWDINIDLHQNASQNNTSISSDIADIFSIPILKENWWIYFEINNEYEINNIIPNLQNMFKKWYYVVWLNYQELQEYLFNWKKLEWNKLLLWKSIEKFDTEEKEIYSKRFRDKSWVIVFEFSKIIIEKEIELENWKKKMVDEEIQISIDKILSVLIENWIVFWFQFERIMELIEEYKKSNKYSIEEICVKKEPENWEDAKIQLLMKISKDLRPIIDEKTDKADLKRYICNFPQVKDLKQPKIIRKIEATRWKDWRDIYWKEIKAKPWKEQQINRCAGEWTKIETIDWVQYLIATQTWYISRSSKNVISISKEAVNETEIWPKTGIIHIWENFFVQSWDILPWYWVSWKNITIKSWDVYWYVNSEWWEIIIMWNIHWWQIINDRWNIIIKWKSWSDSYIRSVEWNIEMDYAENAIIIWNNIKIRKATNCKIIWNNIEILESFGNKIHWISVKVVQVSKHQIENKTKEKTSIISPVWLSFLAQKKIRIFEMWISNITDEISDIENKIKELNSKISEIKNRESVKKWLAVMEALKKWKINEKKLDIKQKEVFNKLIKMLEENLFILENELSELNKLLEWKKIEYDELHSEMLEEQEYINQAQQALSENQQIKIDRINDWHVEVYYYAPETHTFSHILKDANFDEFLWYCKSQTSINHQKFSKIVEWRCDCKYSDIKDFVETSYKKFQQEEWENFSSQRLYHRLELINDENIVRVLNWEEIINPKLKAAVKIDWIWQWNVIDFSWKWLAVWIKENPKKPILIEEWDKIKIELKCLNENINCEFVVRRVSKKDWYVVIWWYFYWTEWETQKTLIELKNRLERIKHKWVDPKEEIVFLRSDK